MTARFLWPLLAICSVIAAPAATGAPRDVVHRIATLIENNYFDLDKAHEIADDLRGAAQAGRFDALDDPRDLVAALNKRLWPLDHHFNVTWTERAPAESQHAASSAAPSMSPDAVERRSAYGFRRVEMLPGAIGYIDMSTFAYVAFGKPDEPARKAADAALALVSGADAVIFDLRNNAGGSPAMVGYLVSAFTPPDADIYNVFHTRDGTESEQPKEPYSTPRLDVPLYVLISGRTASAAESMAYTLQAAKRALVVGEVSRGAANPGGEFPVGEDFNVFISVRTPVNAVTGTNWDLVGVKPDIPVAAEDALLRAQILALEVVLAKHANGTEPVDTRWVLEALRAEQNPRTGPPLTDYVGKYSDAKISAANGNLELRHGRRPAWALVRLHDDVFFVRAEPFRRVLFERDAAGKVTRFQFVRASGQASWFRR